MRYGCRAEISLSRLEQERLAYRTLAERTDDERVARRTVAEKRPFGAGHR